MDERNLEARLLELAFTTEAPITATALAFFAPCSLQDASALLDRLAVAGTLRIESDDEGNIYYEMPSRARVAAPTAQALAKRPPPTTLGRPAPTGADRGGRSIALDATVPLVNPVMNVGPAAASTALATAATAELATAAKAEPATAGDLAVKAADPSAMVECPYCAEPIRAAARKCKHCGEMLDPALRHAPQPVQVNVQNVNTLAPPQHQPRALVVHDNRHTSPGIAALLSFFWPGAGQIYTGRVGQGLLWLLGTMIGYIPFIIPGLILHVVCMFNAANAAKRDNAARARALLGAGEQPSLMP